MNKIEYNDDEYAYLIYDFVDGSKNRQDFNRLELETMYSMNVQNLFYFYQSMINQIYKGLLNDQRVIRLSQNKKAEWTQTDLLYNISFAYKQQTSKKKIYDINEVDGIFPEIGAMLAGDHIWQNLLFDFTPLKYNRQYSWILCLIDAYYESDLYQIKESIYSIAESMKKAIGKSILPYITTIHSAIQIENF